MNQRGRYMSRKNIIPGSMAWENICQQCGLCCLVKVIDSTGRIWLTNVRCDMLDASTRKCKCYNSDIKERDIGADSCLKHNGSVLNFETLHNDYVVPGCCPYAQSFCRHDSLKKCAKHPNVDWEKTVPESSVPQSDLLNHKILGTFKYFKYNPSVNAKYHCECCGKHR